MAVHVQNISIARHAALGGGSWELQGLTGITTIFGRNGSGKSQLLRAWRDQSAQYIHYVTPERSGEMDMQPQLIAQEYDGNQRKSYATRNFTPDYRRRIVARILTYFSHRGNYRDGTPPSPPDELEQYFGVLMSDFQLKLNPAKQLPYELVRNDGNQTITTVDQLSSGEAQLVTIALDVLTIAAIWNIQSLPNGVLLIDEPDAHIHPDLQVRFADFICRVANDYNLQLVIATHSTSLLAALGNFGGDESSVVYLNRTKTSYVPQRFDNTLRELSAVLGGHALMGPLFGAPILLVEGDDDFRIWGQVPRHHQLNLSVIPCGGDDILHYQRKLEAVLASMTSTTGVNGYALRDGDKNLPVSSVTNPQEKIRFIGLSCLEAENLYLTNEVLSDMGLTWESAQAKIRAATGYGNKDVSIRSVAEADRMRDDIKANIHELADILDEKKLHWTVRVGKAIGRDTPSGELRKFLGESVMNSLWYQ